MKEKIKIICLILLTISIFVFVAAYTFRTLVDIGCSSPSLRSAKETGTNLEKFISAKFLNVNCSLWNRTIQFQGNYY